MRLSPRTVGIVSALVTVAIWTSFIVIARASAQRTLLPFDIGFLRVLGAGLVLLPWGWWLARRGAAGATSLGGLSPLPWRATALLGTFGGVCYAALAYAGFFFAPATHGAVLLPGSLPLWTALLAAAVLGDRIGAGRAAGLALIVAGGLLVGGRSLLAALDGGAVWKGDLLFMLAAACWAAYSVLARRAGVDPVRSTIAITAFACATYLPAYLLLALAGALPSHLGSAPWGEIAFQMLFQGVGSVAISGITFTRMVQTFGPVRSTMVTALVPGLAAIAAVLLLDEPLHWNLVAGLVLVTAGILFGVRAARPAPAPTACGSAA